MSPASIQSSSPASRLARSTEVTLKEWSQILRMWGPPGPRRSRIAWLQREYGLAKDQADTIVHHSGTHPEDSLSDPRLRLRD